MDDKIKPLQEELAILEKQPILLSTIIKNAKI